jgi:hypothetical protein
MIAFVNKISRGMAICGLLVATPLTGHAEEHPQDSAPCRVMLESASRDACKGIYILDQKLAGQIPCEFETAPGRHKLEILFPGRRPMKNRFSCQADEQKSISINPRGYQERPSWVEKECKYRIRGHDIAFNGTGTSQGWGKNVWVQVMLADLRARMDILRMMDNYISSLSRDYGEEKDYHIQKATRSVIMLTADLEMMASRLVHNDRWLSQEGVLFSNVSLKIPMKALAEDQNSRIHSCAGRTRLVFYQDTMEEKILDQAVIILDPAQGSLKDIAQSMSKSGGQVWSAKENIPFPQASDLCIGDIQREGRCTSKGADYVESIGLYQYPPLLPLGQLLKDYSTENPYGCQFR